MLQTTLTALGLSDTETKVYLAILPLGTVPASTIGLRLKIPRSTAKYTCEQLEKKGLILGQSKNNTFFYTAKDPNQLYSLLAKEKKLFEKKEDGLNRMMGSLKDLFREDLNLPKVRFFEGDEGLIQMFNDVLAERKPLYGCLYWDEGMDPELGKYLKEFYIPERKRLHFPAWLLFTDDQDTRDYQKRDLEMNRISLLVPYKEFPFDICYHIYGDKIAFYTSKPNMMGVIIENSFINKTQFSIFKMAWNFARKLKANKAYEKVEI